MISSQKYMQQNSTPHSNILLAIVGMPGSGKSETATFFKENGYSLIRFGDITEEGLKEKGQKVTPENEESYRVELRRSFGMAAYAIKSEGKIQAELANSGKGKVIIDGLYSWEEYQYLLSRFPFLKLIHVYAEPELRYKRLAERAIRPFTREQARSRDIAEIERLNKGGPIAIADYLIVNDSDIAELHKKIDSFLSRLENER